MSNSIKKNYIYNLVYQILLLITPLITTPYLSRVLGADGIGIVSFAESNATYFVLFATMGISIYGQREISCVQNSEEMRSIVFWNVKALSLFTSCFSIMAYLLFAIHQKDRIVYLVFTLSILNVAADVTWFFQGMEEFGRIVIRNVVFKVINIVYIFLAVRTAKDVVFLALGHTVFLFLGNLSLWYSLPGYIQKPKLGDIHPFRNIKEILSLFIPTIAIQVYTVLDKTMIGVITHNSFENGYYEQALKIIKMMLPVVTALGTVMIPRITYHFNRCEIEEVKHLMFISYRFVWLLGVPVVFGLIGIAANFVPWFFGPGYEKVTSLIYILSFLVLLIGISNVTGIQYFIPTKRQRYLSLSVILGAIINFLLNMILIKEYESTGAAISSVVAEMTVTVSQLYFVRKELPITSILKMSIPYCFAGLIMACGVYFASKILTPSIIHTVMLIICGVIIYFAVLIIIRDEFLLEHIKKTSGKLIKVKMKGK